MTGDLTTEQRRALDLVLAGRSIFLTGNAGTGKSHTLRVLLSSLERRNPPGSVVLTASTWLAASSLGGMSLHAFAGTGGEGPVEAAVKSVLRNERVLRQWRACRVLVVDEVSMVHSDFFDKVEEMARRIRGSPAPFGGIQLVLTGDFFQLPPVQRNKGCVPRPSASWICTGPMHAREDGTRIGFPHMSHERSAACVRAGRERSASSPVPRNRSESPRFCFQSGAWARCVQESVVLTRVFRQSDLEFIGILNRIRTGEPQPDDLARLRQLCTGAGAGGSAIKATQLQTHRQDTDRLNLEQLDRLPGSARAFPALDAGDSALLGQLASSCPAVKSLRLKEGAQVMLVRTIDHGKGLINGSRGVVEGFDQGLPVVRFANGVRKTVHREKWTLKSGPVQAERSQVPLQLAWAISVHKSQGMSLDAVEINLERAFEPGMAYVALSRARSPQGLKLVGGIDPRALQADPVVKEFYRAIHAGTRAAR